MSIQMRINDTIFIRLWFNCYYFRDRYNNRCDIHCVLVPRVLSPHLLKDGSKYSYYSFLPKVYIFPSDLRGIIQIIINHYNYRYYLLLYYRLLPL
jgi:hypothetical protein